MSENWLVVVESQDLGVLGRLTPSGPVTVLVVGDHALAVEAACAGVAGVHWIEPALDTPVEAYAADAAGIILAESPRLVAATAFAPAARAVLGSVAAGCGAALLSSVIAVSDAGDHLNVESGAAGGAVVANYEVSAPLCALMVPEDETPVSGPAARVTRHPVVAPAPFRIIDQHLTQAGGLITAARVVGVGRGLRSKADLGIIEALAERLDAELACSMPVSEDLGWLPRDRFIGRSGQQISPKLYLAVGLSGAPQHLQGVRGAKVVVAINSDPEASIFRAADYGIVGDLYEIVPALTEALTTN